MNEIDTVLWDTISPDARIRSNSEKRIEEASNQNEFIFYLLRQATSNSDPSFARICGVTFKNIIKRNWGPTPDLNLSPEVEEEIRSTILEALLRKGHASQQLSEAVCIIAKKDYPEKWTTLVPTLTTVFASEQMDLILIVLQTMSELFRKFRYESKSHDLWTELKMVLNTVQEPLTNLFVKLIEAEPQVQASADVKLRNEWDECVLHIVKNFYSLSTQDLPEYFEDNISKWANGFIVLLNAPMSSNMSTDVIAIKAEVFHILTMYAQRFEEEFGPYIQNCLGVAWKTLVETNDDIRFDRMICAALEFISVIAGKVQYAQLFQDEVLKQIIENICIKALRLRDVDIELWEDDAVEYLNQDLQGSNIGTRKRGAVDLVRSLFNRFEQQTSPMLISVIQELVSNGNWKSVDVVYSLVNAICSKTETAKAGATAVSGLIDVCDFYTNQVRLHLAQPLNEAPMLKADALKFVVTFRNQLKPDMLVEVISTCIHLLTADLPILHKYSAYCIEKLLLMRNAENSGPLLTANVINVPSLLQNLVNGFSKDKKAQHTSYLMKAILRVIAILDDDTARHAKDIASELVKLVEGAVNEPADAVHTHFLFECTCLLVQKTSKLPDFTGLDDQLLPLISKIIEKDLTDLIPYALQLVAALLITSVSKGNISEIYVSFATFLLSDELWRRSVNVPAALCVLEIYLKYQPDIILSNHSPLVLQRYQKLIGSKSLDKYGFQLASILLPVLENIRVDDPSKLIWSFMFQRIQNSKTALFVKQFVCFIARFAIIRGPQQLIQALTAIQANMFSMIMERVVLTAFAENLKNMTTAADKRILVIGFSRLLNETPSALGSLTGDIIHQLVDLIEGGSASDKLVLSPEEEQASMYNAEGEFTNPFCRLSYAPRQQPLAPEITNVKSHLAQILNKSDLIGCIGHDDLVKLRCYV